jgi:hypothetical protein
MGLSGDVKLQTNHIRRRGTFDRRRVEAKMVHSYGFIPKYAVACVFP